jgi:hypothetical protein
MKQTVFSERYEKMLKKVVTIYTQLRQAVGYELNGTGFEDQWGQEIYFVSQNVQTVMVAQSSSSSI